MACDSPNYGSFTHEGNTYEYTIVRIRYLSDMGIPVKRIRIFLDSVKIVDESPNAMETNDEYIAWAKQRLSES